MDREHQSFDVLIVGGGPAGLSAALLLGRSRRSVLVCDANEPRNSVAAAAHSFLTRDGTPPLELRRIAREQLAAYPNVMFANSSVTTLNGSEGAFEAGLDDGSGVSARVVVIASGVVDVLPEIPGFAELWGTGVIHCPYCDGWEVRDQELALFSNDENSAFSALFHRQWSRDFALLTNGPALLTPAERDELSAKHVGVYERAIDQVERREDGVRIFFDDGSTLERRAIFVRPAQRPRAGLAEVLGCEMNVETPTRPLIRIDPYGRTTVPGVLAAGDVAIAMQHLAEVAGSGSTAGVFANFALMQMDRAAESAALGLPPLEIPE